MWPQYRNLIPISIIELVTKRLHTRASSVLSSPFKLLCAVLAHVSLRLSNAILFSVKHYSGFLFCVVVWQQNKLDRNLSRESKLWRLAAAILLYAKEQVVAPVFEKFMGREGMEIVFFIHSLKNAFI